MSKNFMSNLYTSSKYTDLNPNYHLEDSPFKWSNFEKCLKNSFKKNKIEISSIKSICEIGCGAGGILNQLKNSNIFNSANKIEGWDINPGAIKIAKTMFPEIMFINDDLFNTNYQYDLIICADVFEHVENPYSFLKELKKKSKYFLFNIPLELSLLSMLRGINVFRESYESVGHLHFYSASSANLILEISGYEIIEKKFAKNRTGLFFSKVSLKKIISTFPQLIIESFSPYLSSALMGDSLVVLAK